MANDAHDPDPKNGLLRRIWKRIGLDDDQQQEHHPQHTPDANDRLKHLLGTALQPAKEGVVLTDTNRRILYVNASFTHKTGYTLAEIRQFGLHHLQGPNTDSRTLTEIDAALGDQRFFFMARCSITDAMDRLSGII
jgi:hypothetical protein